MQGSETDEVESLGGRPPWDCMHEFVSPLGLSHDVPLLLVHREEALLPHPFAAMMFCFTAVLETQAKEPETYTSGKETK